MSRPNKSFTACATFTFTHIFCRNSQSCGSYCLAFSVFRVMNPDMNFEQVINNHFTSDVEANERYVVAFVKRAAAEEGLSTADL